MTDIIAEIALLIELVENAGCDGVQAGLQIHSYLLPMIYCKKSLKSMYSNL